MKRKKIKILIVEKSDIICLGLSAILLDRNNTPISIEICNGDCVIPQSVHKASPKILIASPSVFERYDKEINALKEKYQMLFVGLVYSFQHPEALTQLDAVIYLNDKADKIKATIDELLQSSSSVHSPSANEPLTGREKEILKQIVEGNTTKQIANTLHISTHTVNAHRKNIMRKLDIRTVSGLTIYAVLNNIIQLKEV